LKLLHPFMPFITEELWAVTGERTALLALSPWSKLEGLTDDKAEAEIGWVIELITAIRSIRAEMNITVPVPLVLAGASGETQGRAERWADFIKRLARVSEISSATAAPKGSVQLVVRGEVAALPLVGVIDLDAERARLAKEMAKADSDIARIDAKLGNPKFVERAAEDVVEEERSKRAEAVGRKAKIAQALESLKGA
jgi:valyl-tRNA synthetase